LGKYLGVHLGVQMVRHISAIVLVCGASAVPANETLATACVGSSADLNAADCAAWIDLFDGTGGLKWATCTTNRLDPCRTTTTCYSRVTCAGGHITSLALNGNKMVGKLSASIAGFSKLQELSMSENYDLQGTLPAAALSKLTLLTRLNFANDRLDGSIPGTIAKLAKLKYLNLERNLFTGVVPKLPFRQYTFGCCLQQFQNTPPDPHRNQFSCPLPAGTASCNCDPQPHWQVTCK
jgi:hypothetical protein